MIIWIHCLIILLTWAFKFSWYLFAGEEICYFGYINAYHIDTFQKHGNLTVQSQHKTSYLYWMNCWHANRWKEDIDWNGWIKKQAQCNFILKFQNINYKYWTGFRHTSHSQSSKSLTLWMEPSATTAQPLTENLKSKRFKIYFRTSINQSSSTTFTDLKVWMHIFFKSVDSLLNADSSQKQNTECMK